MNNIQVGDIIGGFRVERIRESAELGGKFYEMRHEKTGARLYFVDNGEANKLFCIGFKTLPEDSTGVFHILEHSVLCGSEKYPVKEPFVDLLKSSLNTFLNAMTFPDKTIYPVSSRNERDFLNLTEVYLDAVFAPRCVIDPNAFRQEGWHLEVGEDGKPFINGVVYNEMKGATSGLDDILEEGMTALLFPDNCYGFNSGGDPACIPQLTYDMYKAMYRKYYHPSNSYIYLSGSVPLEATLGLIDGYLAKYDKQEALHEIPMQAARAAENTLYYEVGPDEPEEHRSVISFGRIISPWSDKRRYMAANVLCSLLADTNEAPLKRAILEAGLGEDVELDAQDSLAQTVLTLSVRNTDADKKQAIRDKVREVVGGILEKGIDKELLTAQLNRMAFRLKDMPEPASLYRCIMSYNSALYGGDPMQYLEFDEDIKALRVMIDDGGFDALLKELFDMDAMCVLTVLPSASHGEKLREEEAARAKAMFDALTEDEKVQLFEDNRRLHAWQETPDLPEDTAKLPKLPLSEVGEEPMFVPTELSETEGVRVMYHPVPSRGITHINLYFNLSDLTLNELSAAELMTKLLTKLPTAKHSAAELQKLIKTYIGSLRFTTRAAAHKDCCTPYLAVFCDVLDENLKKAEELIEEILLTTELDMPDRIKENVLQIDEATKQRMITAGHVIGITAVSSHCLPVGPVNEATVGYTYRCFIKELAKDFDNKAPELISIMKRIQATSFCALRMTVGLTATEKPCVCGLISAFPKGEPAPETARYESPVPEKFGVRIPAQVSFAENGVAVPDLGGSMKVAANLISLAQLWNRVRVQGGAYGVGLRANVQGAIFHYSYRDPSPVRSLEVYGEDSAFITAFCEGEEDLEKYVISAIGSTEPLQSPAEQGEEGDANTLEGRTLEDARRFRREMLKTDRAALLALRQDLDRCANEGCVCVIGCDSALANTDMPVYDM